MIPWRRKWLPTPVLLPGKFHGLRSLVGYSPWGPESDMTERLHFTLRRTEKDTTEKKMQILNLNIFSNHYKNQWNLVLWKENQNGVVPREFSKMEQGGPWGSMTHTRLLCLDGIKPFEYYCPNKGIQNIWRNSRYLSGPFLQNNSWLLLRTNISWLMSESITIITRHPGLGRSPGERIGYPLQYSWTSLVAQTIKNLLAVWETWIGSPGAGRALGKGNGYPLQYSCHKE